MRFPQVGERMREAPAHALRAMFAGLGQVLLVADRMRSHPAGPDADQPGADKRQVQAPRPVAAERVAAAPAAERPQPARTPRPARLSAESWPTGLVAPLCSRTRRAARLRRRRLPGGGLSTRRGMSGFCRSRARSGRLPQRSASRPSSPGRLSGPPPPRPRRSRKSSLPRRPNLSRPRPPRMSRCPPDRCYPSRPRPDRCYPSPPGPGQLASGHHRPRPAAHRQLRRCLPRLAPRTPAQPRCRPAAGAAQL